MATTVEPPAPVEASTPDALDRADGVELLGRLDGSGYKSGVALVRRADGQMVQLGPLMYALLEEVDGRRTNAELAQALCHRLDRACDEEHVVALAQKLAAQGLLAGHEDNAPPRSNPLLALRWKVLVTNPRTTRWLTAPFTFLFRPWLLWPVVAAFVVVCWYVLFEKGVASAVASSFDRPELMLLVVALGVASAGFHELGHAAACRYGGATPSGMGMGIYMVWPAFYTDVTDSYRLPRRDRLRVDLGGIYFNAIVAVATLGVWLLWRQDALLLLVALQLLMIVKNLSPVIRSDGYHILADATGVPDLYAHLGPTLRRLIPGRRREPSALKGRARALVTVWVLVIVPVLLSMLVGAVLILPRLLTSTWDSGRQLVTALPHDGLAGGTADAVRLVALVLPLLGSALVVQRLAKMTGGKALAWSEGSPARRSVVAFATAAALCGTAWAMWPSGQYRPVRASDRGTLVSLRTAIASPTSVARPRAAAAAAPLRLAPGTHLAVSMIPVGGATRQHPALFVIQGSDDQPAVAILSASAPDTASAPTTTDPAVTTATTTTTESTTSSTTTTPSQAAASQPVAATAFPFELPKKPGPGGTQAVAVNTTDGAVRYDIAYALVTVKGGAPVTNTNSAFALASCNRCTTVAVSFQVVLIVGRSALIAPIDAAGALNVNCPACVTTAIADQLVITLKSQPTEQLVTQIQAALKQLDALPQLGAGGTPAAVATTVATVQKQIETALAESGLVANPPTTSTTTTAAVATTTAATTTTHATTTTATPPTTTSSQATTTVSAQTTPATTTTSPATTTTDSSTTTSSTTTTTTAPTTTSATTTTPAQTTTTAG